jgi:hypothetical protein
MMAVKVPTGVVAEVTMLNCVELGSSIELLEKEYDVPLGASRSVTVTVELNRETGRSVMSKAAVPPCCKVALFGATLMVKSDGDRINDVLRAIHTVPRHAVTSME